MLELDQLALDAFGPGSRPMWTEFASDAWLPARLRAFTDLVRAEGSIYRAVLDVLRRWAARLHGKTFQHGQLDASVVTATMPWFRQQIDDVVEVEIRTAFADGYGVEADEDWEPNANARVLDFIEKSRNRLVQVPDQVYASIQSATMKATTDGWSIDELTERVDDILADSNSDRWRNRARVIARTEAIGAYNGGRYAQFQSYATQAGGTWDKIWLATHDHRTRPTHARETGADGQRVPLGSMFTVGGFPMLFPGWPEGPPQEVIQCRCSLLLARPGEEPDLSNRHFRGLA